MSSLFDLTQIEDMPLAESKIKVEKGDLWQLGGHRLLCGDATNVNDVDKLLHDKKVDLVFTDPPYNMQFNGKGATRMAKSMTKLKKSLDGLLDFNPKGFLQTLNLYFRKNIMNAYIFCNKDLILDYLTYAKLNNYSINVLVWKKPNPFPTITSHYPDIEYIIFMRKNAIYNSSVKNVDYSRCLQFNKVQKTNLTGNHPTVKPFELIINEIKISSNEESIVADQFCGSGSTLIACERTKRFCYGIEIEPYYCGVIIDRWQRFTGKIATKIN